MTVSKLVFLVIRAAEDPVTKQVGADSDGGAHRTQFNGMESQVPRLETIGERDPSKIADGKHIAKTVGGDVHGGEEGGLVVEAVRDIPELESEDEPHGVCDLRETATTDGLFAGHADIDEDPENEAWTQLVEGFEIKGTDRGIEFTANEELKKMLVHTNQEKREKDTYIVEDIARVSTESKKSVGTEGRRVAINRLNDGHNDRGGQ